MNAWSIYTVDSHAQAKDILQQKWAERQTANWHNKQQQMFWLQYSKEHSPGAQTSKGSPPSSPHLTSWMYRLNRWECVCGGHTRSHSGVGLHTSGRSSYRMSQGSLEVEYPCTESPYSAQHGWSPPPLLPGPPVATQSSAYSQQLHGVRHSLLMSVSSWQLFPLSLVASLPWMPLLLYS